MEKFIYLERSGEKVKVAGDRETSLGTKFEEQGIFAGWNWDGQKLLVKNDRYGFYPLYYACGENSLAVSPSIQKLLELGFSTELDEKALAVFLRLGWFIGEDTAFRAIRAMPPKATLVWQDGKFEILADGIIVGQAINISRREAVQTYSELFQKAVEKNLPTDDQKAVVPLSGGRDSRHILLALDEIERNPAACLTVLHPPPRPNEDARIAAEVCRAVGVRHILVEQSNSRFENERRKNELTGFSVFEHGWFLALADFIRERFDAVYDGIAGDVLSAGLFLDQEKLDLYRAGKFELLADKILEKEGYLPSLLKKDFYVKLSRENAIKHLTKEISLHALAPNPVGSFYFWNRTRRCIAVSPFRLIGEPTQIITPYLEDELFDFLSSLPAEMFLDHQFHTEAIKAAYPKFAHIGYEKKNAGEIKDTVHFKKYSRDILRYALTRRKNSLTNRSFLLSRCLRGILDAGYSRNVIDFGDLVVFLMQIEKL